MENGPSDSSGIDDDLPPPDENMGIKGRIIMNGRTTVTDLETQIHQLEREAYGSVLRAFKAQSDTLTWEKQDLITEFRKELNVSDLEHRELLSNANADDIIKRLREWRQDSGTLPGLMNYAQSLHESLPSRASHKRKNTSQLTLWPLKAPLPAMHSQLVASSILSSVTPVKHETSGTNDKEPKPVPSLGMNVNRSSPSVFATKELTETTAFDHRIDQNVMTRWPEDINFY